MTCAHVREQLPLLLYGELSFEEEERLEEHLEHCLGCREALEGERAWHRALNQAAAAPPQHLLAECRARLSERLERLSVGHAPWWSRLAPPWVWKPAAALALLIAGFLSARLVPDGASRWPLPSAPEPVAVQVRSVEPGSSGKVRIVLEETRQRVLTGTLEDDRIRRLLLTAASASPDPGLRALSMDVLRVRTESPDVREALLHALRSDPNPGVRLKALQALRPYASDAQVRAVLAQVLLADDNAGVRIEAIDLLTQHKELELAGLLQELLHKEENLYVRDRCQKALREMNASVETF
ncbi:MAG: HEAT repeat domain-containing protein [Bryobacterales bacterium]|nr:HEAT repeat domain-containing protein [Bryobacteraceae bacterium]MDW8353395.1 HEAT repeat domain-containing protein [Bryobacterales bacterium]